MEGYLHACIIIAQTGYCLFSKSSVFEKDIITTASDDWKPQQVFTRSYLIPDTTELFKLSMDNAQHLPPDFRNCLALLYDLSKTPKSLKEISIFAIRRFIGSPTKTHVEKLPLPRVVKNAILLEKIIT